MYYESFLMEAITYFFHIAGNAARSERKVVLVQNSACNERICQIVKETQYI